MTSTGLGSTALVNHYGDASGDSPAWTTDTASSGTVTTRRYLTGFAGLLAEAATTGATTTTTVELTGLHGDVLRTTSPGAAASPDGAGVYTDEYGQVLDPDTGSVTTGPRYGWLGGKQRATDTGTTGLTLMGVRLYAPATGRFLSTDPVYGGNANTYGYPDDPIDQTDLSGAICGCGGHPDMATAFRGFGRGAGTGEAAISGYRLRYDDGTEYVGLTRRPAWKRWREHASEGSRTAGFSHAAVERHFTSWRQARIWEQQEINRLGGALGRTRSNPNTRARNIINSLSKSTRAKMGID